uniref:NADH dehydrogenase subunit 4L n=1 Tax=Spilosoma lubricipeda TaxID=875880 RepID=A0A7G5XR33_9NEOP|nr:NADH dehydrogenase subunit 4L [Spilosoma lubricipeda]QNA48238.1 NADH dehydrogenase subunit 4L [Spilosoma lubricipeda]UOD77188.1 NADH dehydrogenase subunit 4L [Spilosoma lubricipeda]UYX62246.1 NADH dehydrogenase subunit 4L [Spilosoma lubricipeda]
MMIYMWFIFIFMFIIGNLIFVLKHKHLLIILLSLEYIVLSMFFFINLFKLYWIWYVYINSFFSIFSMWGSFSFIYFSFYNSYSWNDYFQSYNIL